MNFWNIFCKIFCFYKSVISKYMDKIPKGYTVPENIMQLLSDMCQKTATFDKVYKRN